MPRWKRIIFSLILLRLFIIYIITVWINGCCIALLLLFLQLYKLCKDRLYFVMGWLFLFLLSQIFVIFALFFLLLFTNFFINCITFFLQIIYNFASIIIIIDIKYIFINIYITFINTLLFYFILLSIVCIIRLCDRISIYSLYINLCNDII
jgi:hypothetical protein